MKEIKIRELNYENFRVYGTFHAMIDPKAINVGVGPIAFYPDLAPLNLGQSNAASFSVCRVEKRPAVIDTIEMHTGCGEGILPLDGDIVIHVAPPTPNGVYPVDRLEAFRVPKGTFVALRRGVWHHAPYAAEGPVNTLIVLPERTYAEDCLVYAIHEADRVAIAGL